MLGSTLGSAVWVDPGVPTTVPEGTAEGDAWLVEVAATVLLAIAVDVPLGTAVVVDKAVPVMVAPGV